MKVIFLDFDGVINNWNKFNEVAKENVLILKKIINLTNANVVAITSLKYILQENINIIYEKTNYYKYIKELLKYGIEISDITPYKNRNREEEIIEYLNNHPEIEEYVILDDEYISDNLKEHQVLPDLYNGLKEEHIIPALNILNNNLGFYPYDYNFEETVEERIIRINNYHNKVKRM